ncbi:MAG: hypothetical protein OEZ36_05805, partial [Spirochaetota bacterium]|nr:hypothetical protein [Spirochaetota bacterium]
MKFFCLNVLAFVMLFSITTNSFSLRLQSKDNLKGSSVNLFDHIEKYEEYIIQRRHKLISWSLQAFFAVDTAISNGENNVRVTGYAGLTSFCKSDIDKYLQLPSSQYNDYGVMFFSNSKSTSEPNISGVIDGVSETAIMARMKRDDLLILAGLVKVDKQYSQWSSTSGTYQDLPGSTTYKPIIYSTFMDIGMSFLANEISSIEQFNLGYKFHIIDNYFEAGPKFTYYEIDSTVQLGV